MFPHWLNYGLQHSTQHPECELHVPVQLGRLTLMRVPFLSGFIGTKAGLAEGEAEGRLRTSAEDMATMRTAKTMNVYLDIVNLKL
jgi:hypothetical protein